eukprot:s1614_g5.t1
MKSRETAAKFPQNVRFKTVMILVISDLPYQLCWMSRGYQLNPIKSGKVRLLVPPNQQDDLGKRLCFWPPKPSHLLYTGAAQLQTRQRQRWDVLCSRRKQDAIGSTGLLGSNPSS